jgi:hypothetical protein
MHNANAIAGGLLGVKRMGFGLLWHISGTGILPVFEFSLPVSRSKNQLERDQARS